jgi:hypothetical protein
VLSGGDTRSTTFQRQYHTAHAGRRAGRTYRLTTQEVKEALGETLFAEHPIPPAFAATMGDFAYLLRHPELERIKQAIALVQAR